MSYSKDELDRTSEIFPVKKVILFVFFTVLSCAYFPAAIASFGQAEPPIYTVIPAFIIFVTSIVIMFTSVKRLGYSISFTLMMFLLSSYASSPIIPAMLASVVLVFALGGFLSSLCNKHAYALLILIPLLSYLGAYALTGEWLISLIAVIPFPSIVAQGILQRKNTDRKTIILVSASLLVAMVSAFGALTLYTKGMLNYNVIDTTLLSFRDGLADYMKSASLEVGGEIVPVFEAAYVDEFVAQAFNLLPGFAVAFAFALIYYSHSIHLALYNGSALDIMVTKKTTKISMSIYAASLFVLAYILSLSTDTAGNPDLLSVVAGNLRIMLTPGLFLIGFDAIAAIMRKLRGLGFFVLLLLLVGIFTLADYIILILAGLGAVYIIITSIDLWAQGHYSKKNL